MGRDCRRCRGDAGFVGGAEGILFGVVVFVFDTLLLFNAWAVIDAKMAVSSAARETARTLVEGDGDVGPAVTAGREAFGATSSFDEADLAVHPHLAARQFFRTNSSADVPEAPFPGHLWRWDGPPLAWGELNVMGRDNAEIFKDIVGLDEEELAALDAEGHLTDGYRDGAGNPL